MNYKIKYKLLAIFLPFFSAVFCELLIAKNDDSSGYVYYENQSPNISKLLIDEINSENISNFLKNLTRRPQLAGTEMDLKMANYVYNNWINQGLDSVNIVEYKVLLSYPNLTNPSTVSLLDSDGKEIYVSHTHEIPLNATPEEEPYYKDNPPFLAYAPNTGSTPVVGDLVYVNYGRAEDFERIKSEGIDLKGKIAIARYGNIFRGDKVRLAEACGAIGIIIYVDPYDFTDGNFTNTYPNSVNMPPSGVQRGTVYIGDGDPLTPDYPSIDGAYRIPRSSADLPKIPAHAISYLDAQQIMSNLGGKAVPKDWVGGLNVSYNFGPGFSNGNKVRIIVTNYLDERVIHNVIGRVNGETEPDRYVIVGNHRDSWSFGAVDPSSGTAVMLELTRAFAEVMLRENWRPRRSVIFCSWGAEEYGLIGSTEWIEENQKVLQSQVVAYLNIDIAVEGNHTFSASSVPLLFDVLWDATKRVPNPNPDETKRNRLTVYDTWINASPWNTTRGLRPAIGDLGAGSDHTHFLQNVGVSSLTMSYTCEQSRIRCYPLYHTMYETYELESQLMDRGFKYSQSMAQIWIEMTRSLSDSLVIPFSVKYYPIMINENIEKFSKIYEKQLLLENITLDYLIRSANIFQNAIQHFEHQIKNVDLNNPLAVRRVNDMAMMLERAFVEPKGFPMRSDYHHVILAPSTFNDYDGSYFSALYDLMWICEHNNTTTDQQYNSWQQFKYFLSVVVFHINAATKLLTQTF